MGLSTSCDVMFCRFIPRANTPYNMANVGQSQIASYSSHPPVMNLFIGLFFKDFFPQMPVIHMASLDICHWCYL